MIHIGTSPGTALESFLAFGIVEPANKNDRFALDESMVVISWHEEFVYRAYSRRGDALPFGSDSKLW